MSVTLTRSGARTEKRGAGLDLTRPPQVNLLPPEIAAGRALSRLKRLLVFVLLGVVLVAALLVVWAATRVDNAQERVEAANADTTRLLAEKTGYHEVTVVIDELNTVRAAVLVGTRTEVDWRSYIRAIAGGLPEGVTLDEVVVTSATPLAAQSAPLDPLQQPTLATIQFKARSAAVPDTASLMDALATLPGLAYPAVSTESLTGDETTGTYYEVTGQVQVTFDAKLGRFASLLEEAS